jgi:hypothetical protein
MSRQIVVTLTDIKIEKWTVDTINQHVTIYFQIKDDQGNIYKQDYAIFWADLPDNGGTDHLGNILPVPDNWYQLPIEYINTLTNLTTDARSALMHLVQE